MCVLLWITYQLPLLILGTGGHCYSTLEAGLVLLRPAQPEAMAVALIKTNPEQCTYVKEQT